MGPLEEAEVGDHPCDTVRAWLAHAVDAGVDEPNAMTLATVGPEGRPSSRTVLLKGFDDDGFRFFTSYTSCKGRELAANPACSLVLVWPALGRQIRAAGRAERLPREESASYFATRPRGSRLGAWASDQSSVIADREVLERRLAELEETYAETDDIPLPPFWGGYLVVPDEIELWQGRPNRLHDRFRFTRTSDGWKRDRLAP